MDPAPAIRLDALGKRFGDRDAVRDLSLEVRAGEVFGFMGHNGAGKTTTLRMLLGLTRPTSGRASVLGLDAVAQTLEIRRSAGFLPGEFALPKELTARRFLRYVGALFGLSGAPLERRISALLERFGLLAEADRRLSEFSSGMAQKVALAQALLNEPRVLLLDEPTSGLDPIGRRDLLDLVRRQAAEGVTVLFSTHILTDVEQVCERVAILHQGRLLAAGDLDALKRRHGHDRMDDLYLALARDAG